MCRTEEEVYAAVGLPWIAPELREDAGEFDAAESNTLPDLVTLDALQGDLHMHTTWSDGSASIREMAEAALAAGRKYIVITDHSRGAVIANGLSIERLLAQQAEVRAVDAEMNGRIRVFHGTEMDILADGSLDFPDDVLEQPGFCRRVAARQPAPAPRADHAAVVERAGKPARRPDRPPARPAHP
ncbi:MAG: PHP domain-containing protein [Chloroflexi bacterium]|nr:PHP domain-containing protein [Chloroflexota bacterium]